MKTAAITLSLLVLMLAHFASGQSLPSKIRGYKVYDAKVAVTNATGNLVEKDRSDATVRILDPAITGVSLSGAVFEIGAEITAVNQSGKVDFMTCRDLRVNGVPIEIEEYAHPFAFKEGEKITLPQPATISVKTANIAKAAYKELVDPKKDWSVTGTVFVFGKFRRFGFSFKRVVPVKIDLTIRNPLSSPASDPR
ncbi:MAG TPA: hypothetical protein VHQ01_04210 [Pyrinomonadaceae bacterium]|nr:hypothetical protein [Pyrinomonadaceae bacterium]